MPEAIITREPTAHVAATVSNASPETVVNRDLTGRVTGRLDIYDPGER